VALEQKFQTSVGGAVGFDTGFGSDYELPQGSAGRKRIERDKYNGLHHSITENVKQWQEHLYPTWIEDDGTGVAFAYPVGMIVNHAGQNWASNEAENQEEPGAGSKWDQFEPLRHDLLTQESLNAVGGHDAIYDRKIDSISEALVYTKAFTGLTVIVKDRPEASFKYVLASSVTVDGYNIIQCSAPIATLALQRINYQITDLLAETYFGSQLSNLNVVITGDSLSFNGYGYDPAWGVTGTGYATDQWFGLSSWSHLVRDFIVSSNSSFKSMFDLNWYSSGGVVGRGITVADERYFGMNGRVITFNFPNSTSKVIIEANSGLSIGLLVSTALEAFAYKFSVDGVEYDNVTDYPDNYLGGGYKVIPCGAEPVITNVRRFTTLAVGGEFSIYGITSSTAGGANAKYPMITGKGGYTSTQVLAEYSTLVAPYLPDVVFYMIGANDIDSGVPVATFKSNIEQFVDLVRADSPNAKVILLTTTPIARPPWVDGQERPYIKAMQEICDDKYCYLVNVFDEFRNIDPFYWRFDNTHFNKRGNDMMFNLVKDKIMPALPIDRNKFTPLREFYSGLLGLDGKRDQLTNYIEVTCTVTTPTITTTQNGNFSSLCQLSYVADGPDTLLRVVFPDGYRLSSAESMHLNIADPTDELKVKTSSGGIVDIFRTSSGAIAPINGFGSKIRLSAGRFFGSV